MHYPVDGGINFLNAKDVLLIAESVAKEKDVVIVWPMFAWTLSIEKP